MGLLERAHARIKNTLKVMENRRHQDWHKAVDYAVFAHNTRTHKDTRCTPTEMFRGVPPRKALDMRFGVNDISERETNFEPTEDLRDRLMTLWRDQHENLVRSYIKNKEYFDKCAKAQPLRIHSYCLILNPALDTQKQTLNKMDCKWLGFYRVEQCLSRQNYIVRKIGTHHTQCVHRIRLKPISELPSDLKDIDLVDKTKFVKDPSFPEQYLKPTLFDKFREQILREEALPENTDPDTRVELRHEAEVAMRSLAKHPNTAPDDYPRISAKPEPARGSLARGRSARGSRPRGRRARGSRQRAGEPV